MDSRTSTCPMKWFSGSGQRWHGPAALLIVGLSIAGIAAMSRLGTPAPMVKTNACYSAADVSASNGPRLDSEFALHEYVADEVLPADTPLTMWAFSNYEEARKVYSAIPESGMALWRVEKAVAGMVAPRDEGTYPQTAVRAMADSADASTANRIVCLLLWDGEITGNIAVFSRQMKRLADNPKVAAVVCIGVIPDRGIRSRAEKAMQCMGSRLIVCGPHDRSEINRLHELLKH